MTVGDLIDEAQSFLHDDGEIWPRAELLNWATDGYRQLLAQSHAVVRPTQIDVPARTAWVGTQEWEDRFGQGTWRKATFASRSTQYQTTFQWEAEQLDGLSPSTTNSAITHPWEIYYLGGETDAHMRLVLSKQHERPLKVYHDDKRLIGASTREVDTLTTEWWKQTGDPIFWFPSEGGRDGSYEVYQISSAYAQGYHCDEREAGGPRLFSGERTYSHETPNSEWTYAYTSIGDSGFLAGLGYRITDLSTDRTVLHLYEWEDAEGYGADSAEADAVATYQWEVDGGYDSTTDSPAIRVGVLRTISSADRQYLATPYANAEYSTLGVPRAWGTSADSITIWEIIVTADELTETDGLSLIPSRMGKYVKYYILSRAFSRKGRGFRPDLSQHYTALFQLGVGLLSKLGNLGFIDRSYSRDTVTIAAQYRPPVVQFPPQYER